MERFINMPPGTCFGLAIWRAVAESHDKVMPNILPFLRSKAQRYRPI